jgi:hypothetical protein
MNMAPQEHGSEGGAPGLMPGGGDGAGEIASFTSATPARRVSLTNIVLALVLTISASSLYLMRKQGKGAGITFQVSKIDYELEKAPKANSEHERILAELAATRSGAWTIAEKRIQKNPFQIEMNSPLPPPPDTDLERRKRAEQERMDQERRRQDLMSRLSALELNGVMGGTIPLARISGETVRIGDMVAGQFKVTAIHPDERAVEVIVEGELYTLRMVENAAAPKRPASPRR